MVPNVASGFGASSHYYAHPPIPVSRGTKQRAVSQEEKIIQKLLQERYKDLPQRVNQCCKQWNLLVREHLRTETALRLSVGDERQAVPIVIQDGLPFAQLVADVDLIIWELTLHRPRLEMTVGGLQFALSKFEAIRQWLPVQDAPIHHTELERVQNVGLRALSGRAATSQVKGKLLS